VAMRNEADGQERVDLLRALPNRRRCALDHEARRALASRQLDGRCGAERMSKDDDAIGRDMFHGAEVVVRRRRVAIQPFLARRALASAEAAPVEGEDVDAYVAEVGIVLWASCRGDVARLPVAEQNPIARGVVVTRWYDPGVESNRIGGAKV